MFRLSECTVHGFSIISFVFVILQMSTDATGSVHEWVSLVIFPKHIKNLNCSLLDNAFFHSNLAQPGKLSLPQ